MEGISEWITLGIILEVEFLMEEVLRMSESPRYINEKEVSKITGLALSTLRNWRFKRTGMPYSKVGRSVRTTSILRW
jgi:hypothetical protein